jgi:hypothetical protein
MEESGVSSRGKRKTFSELNPYFPISWTLESN